ncbi:MAG TPA: chloride channel protein [Niabella sp.]|nr:chloride channel protein [Niabella sp.]HOZ96815.1 chloride channel protein [Niabella sp.]HQW14708.1 chloride channel protein [Niabella sp.]HQX20040.1 chloride channel protein [Niabella sp.]HQX40660.1 chloride channel protein [Niabella sp.]
MSISISPSLQIIEDSDSDGSLKRKNNRRLIYMSILAIIVGVLISFIAKFLIYLINLITNISFYGNIAFDHSSPADNQLGYWVILIPAIGGLLVGFMALYGSRAIRGHGIPEAMEQILTNDSKIKPTITYLKPISSAIAIGSGGPFGAEGPIIATGGALGSTIGQLLKISHHERKILLAAGATAGMSAIFGSPIAAIFLAIELLLFEFSAASILPVILSCVTGAAGHHFLFDHSRVFAIATQIESPSNLALFFFSIEGLIIGLLSVAVTKIVYWLEELFEHLPIHWMWWPAIGGLAVGIIGYFQPNTLGVGYNNITDVLSGSLALKAVALLCICKFVSWAIALASGTSGGTLAPLLTIGGAAGALIGLAMKQLFPMVDISISLAALVGMSAMFAGASRALITSILFALETTGQVNVLLVLLASCTAAYLLSLFLMENTIMTEKIARRGVRTPVSYKPDVLEQVDVKEVMNSDSLAISDESKIGEAKDWISQHPTYTANFYVVADHENKLAGLVSASSLCGDQQNPEEQVGQLIRHNDVWIKETDSLKLAVKTMLQSNVDLLPVVDNHLNLIGSIGYKNVIEAHKKFLTENEHQTIHISLKRQTLKLLLKGQRLISKTVKN